MDASRLDPQQLQFEEDISRNPYHMKLWWSYLQYEQESPSIRRYMIYERALKYLPRSYKMWHAYLLERTAGVEFHRPNSKKISVLINTYERALVHMHKMPRIWLDYCAFLISMHRGTNTRKAFDRALQALPITQHKQIWSQYIDWVTEFGVAETAVRVYRRFLMFDGAYREDFVSYLESIEQYEEAARQLSICLNDENYVSPSGQTEHQMWMRLCDICAAHPTAVVNSLKVEAIIRSGISKFSDEVGRLWNSLSDFYIRQGQFEKARDIYEEAIHSVTTVRDFSIVFDAYIKVEESVLSTKIRFLQQTEEDTDVDTGADTGGADVGTDSEEHEINMRLARIEYLLEQRPLLLNSVVLRQNPHNVHEWHKRAKLYAETDAQKSLITYVEAVKTVDPKLALGKLSGLWLALARHYETHNDAANARTILSKAVEVNFKTVDELANVWCAWGEMEMRLEQYEKALQVMKQAVTEPVMSLRRRKQHAAAQGMIAGDGTATAADAVDGATSVVQDRVYRSVKIWSLYLDLEESLGSVESCKAAYDRVMELKVITAQMALNYASFLEEHKFFEDSFKVYERAVVLFGFPQVKKIWLTYLDRFLERYGGSKMERLRDLFEQAVSKVVPADAAEFYLKYAKAEEEHGLARHAMEVYARAVHAVPADARLDMYRLYVLKVEQFFGITKTRPIYERALQELGDEDSKALCIDFAQMERKLGEIDRARAVLQYGSQFADPRRDPAYWQQWREFEEAHGNESTFREMLRTQRSVETAFSHVSYLASDMLGGQYVRASVASEAATAASAGVSSSTNNGSGTGAAVGGVPALSAMDALAHDAEREAQERSNKRKFVGNSNGDDGGDPGDAAGPPMKMLKDADELDI